MDSIIVHGAGINDDSSITKVGKSRLDLAVDIYHMKKSPRIILSGGFTNPSCKTSEARSMVSHALDRGVHEEDILLEEKAIESIGNAYFTKIDYLEPNSWQNNIAVSSEWHLPRLNMVFDRVLGENYYTKLFGSHDLEGEELRRAKIKEHIYYILDRFVLSNVKSGDDKAIGRRIESFYNSLDLLNLR